MPFRFRSALCAARLLCRGGLQLPHVPCRSHQQPSGQQGGHKVERSLLKPKLSCSPQLCVYRGRIPCIIPANMPLSSVRFSSVFVPSLSGQMIMLHHGRDLGEKNPFAPIALVVNAAPFPDAGRIARRRHHTCLVFLVPGRQQIRRAAYPAAQARVRARAKRLRRRGWLELRGAQIEANNSGLSGLLAAGCCWLLYTVAGCDYTCQSSLPER